MTSQNIDLDTVEPMEYSKPTIATSAPSILRKRRVEILPESQDAYEPVGNNIMRFKIYDNASMLLGSECYLKGKYYRTSVSAVDDTTHLDIPGITSCIKAVRVRGNASNMVIHSIENYNLIQAMFAIQNDSPPHVREHGYYQADSLGAYAERAFDPADESDYVYLGTATYSEVSSKSVLTFANANEAYARSIYFVEDALFEVYRLGAVGTAASRELYQLAAGTLVGNVYTSTGDNAMADMSNGAYEVYIKRALIPSQRRRICQARESSKDTFCVPLNVPFLQHNIPLFLMKGGIELEIELERGIICHVSGTMPSTSGTVAEYYIDQPRYVVSLSTPEPAVIKSYVNEWQNGSGLIYYTAGSMVRTLTNSAMDVSVTLNIPVGLRSVRDVSCVVIPNTYIHGSTSVTHAAQSLSTYLKSNITSFQVQVGASYFPLYPIDVDDTYAAYGREHYLHNLMETARFAKTSRIDPKEWGTDTQCWSTTADGWVADKTKFIMHVDLSRTSGPASALSGIDLSITPLQFAINRSDAYDGPGSPEYYLIFNYDSFLRLSSRGMNKLN